jgi:hypothetical protein
LVHNAAGQHAQGEVNRSIISNPNLRNGIEAASNYMPYGSGMLVSSLNRKLFDPASPQRPSQPPPDISQIVSNIKGGGGAQNNIVAQNNNSPPTQGENLQQQVAATGFGDWLTGGEAVIVQNVAQAPHELTGKDRNTNSAYAPLPKHGQLL